MNEEALNMSIRKFLKTVGVGSQRELEQAVARGVQSGALAGDPPLEVTMTLEVPALKLKARFDGQLELQ